MCFYLYTYPGLAYTFSIVPLELNLYKPACLRSAFDTQSLLKARPSAAARKLCCLYLPCWFVTAHTCDSMSLLMAGLQLALLLQLFIPLVLQTYYPWSYLIARVGSYLPQTKLSSLGPTSPVRRCVTSGVHTQLCTDLRCAGLFIGKKTMQTFPEYTLTFP